MSRNARSSVQIARKAKSNLAFALSCLPEQRKRDMISFYAFCRVVDDIADDPATDPESKGRELERYKQGVLDGALSGDPVLDEVVGLPAKYGFPAQWLAEIIDGVTSDLNKARYRTIEELLAYCYKVASVVGLVSIEIFGCRDPRCRDYAIHLGYALQLTNIMRDVGEDARNGGRIYLPLEDLQRYGVTEDEIMAGQSSDRFVRLMDAQYERVRGYYQQAQTALPPEERPRLVASEMMGRIYSGILEKLKRHRYPVFTERCRLHPLHKGLILLTFWIRGWGARHEKVRLP